MRGRRPDFWNVWWTLTMISAAFTILVLILEMLGVFHDVGLVLSALGLLLTLVVGFMASTRSSLMELKSDVLPRFDHTEQRLDGMSERLNGTNERLDRVIALLNERLPRSIA